MAMKPRTFRRVVLLGSLGAIIFVVVFGYFVVRPWQNQRQLEAMRNDGVRAFEEGDFVKASKLLGRYTNNAESFDSDLFLMFARARAKVQAEDGGHVAVAINAYREYLRREPGDTEASLELLPLMNTRGMFVEARSLAEGLLSDQTQDDIKVIRELRYSLQQLQARDDELEPVYLAAFEHDESDYTDMSMYFTFLTTRGRGDERAALLAQRMQRFPGRVDEQVYQFLISAVESGEDFTAEDANIELSSIIGLNPENQQWDEEAPELSNGVAWEVSRMYNSILAYRNANAVLTRSAFNNPDDYLSRVWATRRLYWIGDDETLAGLRLNTIYGEPDADVLGYRYLAALRNSDEDTMAELKDEMGTVVLDTRAKAWLNFIDGEVAFRDGDSVAARVSVQKAVDVYRSEPTFHLLMGDVQHSQGRFNEAIEFWTLSSELANGKADVDSLANSSGWASPMIRIVDAYIAQRRLPEAASYISELGRIGQQDPQAAIKLLEAESTLARMGELPDEMGSRFVERWQANKDTFEPETRALLAPMVATILARMDYRDEASQELLSAIEFAEGNGKLLIDIVDIDSRFALGVADQAGIDTRTVGANTLQGALRIANRVSQEQQSTEAGLRYFDSSMNKAPEQERDAWERARVGFLDAREDPAAASGWDELLAANPNDVELHFRAAESNAFSKDLDRVNALIDQITTLNSTPGLAPSSRLRLARANAIVGNVKNRTNRERAIEIVRSVVATEPNNINARNMLGRLLALPPSPGLPESEQYAPDLQGAIDQYTTLARQMSSLGAQTYLLEASDLAFRMGDEEQASSLLAEFTTRFGENWRVLPLVAERYENLGQLQQASDIYRRVIENQPTSDAVLAYTDLQLKLGNTSVGMRLLQQLSTEEVLTQDQLLRLATLYARTGNRPEAEMIASSGDRYGLEPVESSMLFARYARSHMTSEDQIRALRQATEVDPQHSLAWRQLIQRLIELDRYEEARAAYERAIAAIPDDDNIERLGILSMGTPNAADMMRMPGIKDNPEMQRAVLLVDEYNSLPAEAPIEQRVKLLVTLIESYPKMEAAQSYAAIQLSSLRIDPALVARFAEKALKNAKSNTKIMGIAGESALFSNQPELAIRMVQLWRANSLEKSVLAESIVARAMIQLEQYQEAADLLDAYVDEAYQTPDLPVHREILDAFCFARLKIGESPSVTAARLEPLIADNRAVRNQIWLSLAANVIEDPSTGAEWINRANEFADLDSDDDRIALGQAWVRLAEHHQIWDREYAQRAIDLLTPLVQRDDAKVMPLRVISTAYAVLGRSGHERDLGSDDYTLAVEYMLRAADLDEGNLSPLLEAAQFCLEGGLHAQAKAIYERLLSYSIPNGEFKAMLLNNLAMSSLRVGVHESDHGQLLGYVQESTSLSQSTPTFWGTRGWVELELGDATAAEQSFRTLIDLSPDSAEGWAGLVISLHIQGPEHVDEKQAASEKLRQIHDREQLDAELLEQLSTNGLDGLLVPSTP